MFKHVLKKEQSSRIITCVNGEINHKMNLCGHDPCGLNLKNIETSILQKSVEKEKLWLSSLRPSFVIWYKLSNFNKRNHKEVFQKENSARII